MLGVLTLGPPIFHGEVDYSMKSKISIEYRVHLFIHLLCTHQ